MTIAEFTRLVKTPLQEIQLVCTLIHIKIFTDVGQF
jgi:hypothetical protein